MAKGISGVKLFKENDAKDIAEVYEAIPQRVRGEVLMDIPVSLIRPDPNQPRKEKSDAELDDLYKRILATGGITKPIDVKPDPEDSNKFLIEDGECRWIVYNTRYVQETIPSRVLSKSRESHEVLLRQLMANIGGIEMSIVDVAQGISDWMNQFNPKKSNKEAAEAFGWSGTKISRTLKVLKAPKELQNHIRENKLSNINTISRMVDLHSHDPFLFQRCLEETQQDGFTENPESYWNQAYIEATQPQPETQQENPTSSENAVSTTKQESTDIDKSEEQDLVQKGPHETNKSKPTADLLEPTAIDLVSRNGIAVLQIAYMVGKRQLTSDYQLSDEQLTQLHAKLSDTLNKN